jgi:hypothetical protein
MPASPHAWFIIGTPRDPAPSGPGPRRVAIVSTRPRVTPTPPPRSSQTPSPRSSRRDEHKARAHRGPRHLKVTA